MYQIDRSFTRLTPVIDFSDVKIDASTPDWCILGSPPSHLKAVHCPALIRAWHERLVQALSNPTQIETRNGYRRIQVLGCAIFNVDLRSRVGLWVWNFDESDRPVLDRAPDESVAALGAPFEDFWVTGYQAGVLRTLVAHFPSKGQTCQDYVNWASACLVELCWTDEVQEKVRTQIATDLALDAQVLEIASQIRLGAAEAVPARLEQYNHVLRNRRDFLQLQQEAPNLIALYAMLTDDLNHSLELTQSMKQMLRKAGLGTAVWRLLSRVGTQWIQAFLPYFDQKQQALSECAIEIIRLATAFGTRELPPTEVLHALIQMQIS